MALEPSWEHSTCKQKCIGWTLEEEAGKLGITGKDFCSAAVFPNIPPWLLPGAEVDISLKIKKTKNYGEMTAKHLDNDYIVY